MKVKEETKEKFITAMFSLVKALKNEADNCSKACGGFNEKEQRLIMYLGKSQDVKMSDLAEVIDAPMSTITSIVDKLVEKEFLSRYHSEEDRRVINVSLSAKGKTAFKKICTQKNDIAETMLSKLNEKDQESMLKYINILAASVGSK